MAYEFEEKTIETNANGYLENLEDWSKGLAQVIAESDGLGELTAQHWDIIDFLRDEYINNSQNQPNERSILKAMGEKWGKKVGQKDTFALFPKMPSKQGGLVAGLPESRRKSGY